MQVKINQELIDKLATMEVDALLAGLKDPEQCSNPAFLAKVRQWLKDNDIMTSSKVEGVTHIKRKVQDIPTFMDKMLEDEQGVI